MFSFMTRNIFHNMKCTHVRHKYKKNRYKQNNKKKEKCSAKSSNPPFPQDEKIMRINGIIITFAFKNNFIASLPQKK